MLDVTNPTSPSQSTASLPAPAAPPTTPLARATRLGALGRFGGLGTLGPAQLRWGAALLLVAASATALMFFVASVGRHARPDASARLRPDPTALHYRHSLTAPGATPERELDEGIAALEARARNIPPSPFDLSEMADLYFRRAKLTADLKDYARAEELAQRSLAILPSPNSAVLVLARIANTRHEFARAIELALQHSRGHSAGALNALATAHLALGELRAASAEVEELVLSQPTSASYLMRALVMQAQGRDDEAAFDFARAALAEEAGDVQEAARLRSLWARFLLRRGELTGAGQLVAEALRIAPGHPLALAQRGELLLRTGKAKAAAALFDQAFASSRQVRYLIDQARALELSGDTASAAALRTQVQNLVSAELTEGGLGHRLDLIEVLVDGGSRDAAVTAVALGRQELQHRPSAETRFQLARALLGAGLDAEAAEQVQAALAAGTREPQLYELAARLEVRRHNTARAALYSRLAHELDPGSSGWRHAGMGAP